MKTTGIVGGLVLVLFAMVLFGANDSPPEPWRLRGSYRMADGGVFTLTSMPDGSKRIFVAESGLSRKLQAGEADRWIAKEATSGDPSVELHFATDRRSGTVRLAAQASQAFVAIETRARDFAVTTDDGVSLQARLLRPAGQGPWPLLVLVHGSGRESALATWHHADEFAAFGFASLSVDKRGTGVSGGTFTADFDRLARDVSQVIDAVIGDPGIDRERIALIGSSQGGWVAPLVASRRQDIRALLVNYGLLISPAEEEVEELLARLPELPESELQIARRLIDAGTRLRFAQFQGDWADFEASCTATATRPWRQTLAGESIDKMCRYPRFLLPWIAKVPNADGLDYGHDAFAVASALTQPSLWLFASGDTEAPPASSIERIEQLREAGKPIEFAVLGNADHGMWAYTIDPAGKRRYRDLHPDYLATQIAWLRRQFE